MTLEVPAGEISKNILVVEKGKETIDTLQSGLKDLGFSVRSMSEPAQALDVVRQDLELSLLVIDEGIGTTPGAKLVQDAKNLQPDLPIIWIKQNERVATNAFGRFLPDIMLNSPLEADEFLRQAERLLCEDMYPPDIVGRLSNEVVVAFHEGFATEVVPQQFLLRVNRDVLGESNALISFVGAKLSGRLIMSGSWKHLRAIRQRILPQPTEPALDQLEDMLGEIANHVLGRFKLVFHSLSLPFEVATPVFIRNSEASPDVCTVCSRPRGPQVRYKALRPTLSMPFFEGDYHLHVEFCFDLFDPAELKLQETEAPAASGDLEFF